MAAVSMLPFSVPISTPAKVRKSLELPSQGASIDATNWDAVLLRQVGGATPLVQPMNTVDPLAFNRFGLKETISRVAMHLTGDTRKALFDQLDGLLNENEWDADDPLPEMGGWLSLARFLIYLRPNKMPGISFHNGHPVAFWTNGDIRVTVDCLPDDNVAWVASRLIEGEREVSAGDGKSRRLPNALAGYNDGNWLFP